MKPKGYKRTRCEKKSMSKCTDGVARTYNAIEAKYVLNDEGMDADIVNEKVMELLESAGSKERAKIMEALGEISAYA